MKQVIYWIKKNWTYTSPILIGIYPALFLYSQNISEYLEQTLLIPLGLSVALTIVVYGASIAIFRKLLVAAPIATILLYVLLSYSTFYGALTGFNWHIASFLVVTPQSYLILVFALFVLFILLLFKNMKRLFAINKIFTLVSLLLVLLALIPIVLFEIKEGRVFRKAGSVRIKVTEKVKPPVNAPDIYYIMPEDYGGDKALALYGFDNSQFLTALKKRGFYVPSDSTTNYPKSALSLASSLNMEYINYLTAQTHGGNTSDESVVTPLIQNNKVIQFLKNRGYSYIHMGSWWAPTASNPNADKNFVINNGSYWGSDEVTTGFISDTAFAPVLNKLRQNPLDVSADPWDNDHRRRMFYNFSTGTNVIPDIPGPKFVFMHIMAPHEPFVVDKNCTPISETVTTQRSLKDNSLEQIQCVNALTLKMIDAILKKSKQPPIILLQSDEGQFPINAPLDDNISWATANDQALDEKFPIMNAYYLPNGGDTLLYNTITPVNSFRIVFDKYFQANLPLLPDKNYIFQDKNNLYRFTDVTQKVGK